MSDHPGILKAVASPRSILGAAIELLAINGFVSMTIFFLSLNGMYVSFSVLLLHLLSVALTARDPDLVKVWLARARCGFASGIYKGAGNRYVP